MMQPVLKPLVKGVLRRAARYASGLGVLDFMKRTTLIDCSPGGIAAIGPSAVILAEAEGLGAHARSVAVRLGKN